jgi:hypothetical protein
MIVELILGANLAMPESISAVGELDGNERLILKLVEATPIGEDIPHEVRADEQRQILVDGEPLIVPARQSLRLGEDGGSPPVRSQPTMALWKAMKARCRRDGQVDVVA